MKSLMGVRQDYPCADCQVDAVATVTHDWGDEVVLTLSCCGREVSAYAVDIEELLYDDCGV